ncbi:MAG: hypothetical protein ACKVH8_14415 [Pirellulales bacterium]
MKWKSLGNGFISSTIQMTSSVEDAFLDICNQIQTYIIPNNSSIKWDFIKIEFWVDSGRIIIFPALKNDPSRIEKAGCHIQFEQLLYNYNLIADSDMPDDEFTTLILQEENSWINKFIGIAKQSQISETNLMFFDADDQTPLNETFL